MTSRIPLQQVNAFAGSGSPLASLYVGPLADNAPPWLCTMPPEHALSGTQLFSPERLEQVLARFATCFSVDDRRAVASMWTKWYFHLVLQPSLAANVLLERELPLGLDEMHVVLDAHGRPERLCLRHDGLPLASFKTEHRFAGMMAHLSTVIDVLAQLSGAAPRVFWSNVGSSIDYYLSQLESHPAMWPGMTDACWQLLERRELDDGQRNPLFQPVRHVTGEDGTLQRVRKLCCLRYLIPELGDCGDYCPLSCRRRTH
ncbi:siderophore-iron reductase FhuF [Modicisalibacter xianhensis]|uniref:Ferric iron reductase protein FhuF n=1 Tax=Modicisalibacter xianhensis TaxID=442341 RepID=A0A1I3AQB6_9GAMM|nr:siderophore-iron reductase FhuF [Halomonas xianhensis]SFH52182.1 ferric iron reductase protein FhuF [Halomonas xianhensis]